MALNAQQVGELLKMLRQTREVEIACPECLEELDRYTQKILDGEPPEGVLARVKEHLAACPGCAEQFQLVLQTLAALDDE